MDHLRLPIPSQPPNRLRLTRLVDLLRLRQQRAEEHRVVRAREVRPARALVHHVQQQHALTRPVLELLEVARLDGGGPFDFEEGDPVRGERRGDFFHQVWELHEDEDALFFGDAFSFFGKSYDFVS